MAGGLLQLAAYGIQDLYMTGYPEITYFKTVYRRHTNFSTNFQDLNFTNPIDFGRKGFVTIKKWGDLVHRMFLVMELPQIDIVFTSLTISEVQQLLVPFGITWVTDRDPNSQFDQEAFDEVIILINDRIAELENEIDIFNQMLAKLRAGGEFFPSTWRNNNPGFDDTPVGGMPSEASLKYFDDILIDFFNFDQYDIQYRFADAQKKDIKDRAKQLANLLVLQDTLFNIFTDFAVSFDMDPNTFNDENLRFYLNVDIANYIISGSINQVDANTVFRGGITNIYGDTPFLHLDAYNIFDQVLIGIQQDILSNSDIENIKNVLLDSIQSGLTKNVQLMTEIYNTLNKDSDEGYRFIFYRRLPVLTGGSFSKTSSFTTRSIFSSASQPGQLNDRFSDKLTLTPTAADQTLTHPFSDFVTTNRNQYYQDNLSLFNSSLFTSYFNTETLWARTDVFTSPFTPPLTVSVGPRNYFFNYLWFTMAQDIADSIETYMDQNQTWQIFGFTQSLMDDINSQLAVMRIQLINDLEPIITDGDNYSTIATLETSTKTVAGPNGDLEYSAIFRPGYFLNLGTERLLLPDYIVRNYENVLNGIVPPPVDQPFWDQFGKQRLLNIVNLFVTPFEQIPSFSTYSAQNFNIKDEESARINNIGTSTVVYTDVQSSIFNYIFKTFVQNTDDLYNNNFLGFDTYEQSIGSELRSYLDTLARMYFNYIFDGDGMGNFTPYPYYLNVDDYNSELPENNGAIGRFLTLQGNQLLEDFDKFFNNRGLLNMREIILNRTDYYFDRYAVILNEFIRIIETPDPVTGELIYTHQDHPVPGQDIVLVTRSDLLSPTSTEPQNNAMDIALEMRDLYRDFVDSAGVLADPSNPYSMVTDPNKHNLWDEKKNTFMKLEERERFDQLFAFLYDLKTPPNLTQPFVGPSNLFSQLTNIDVNYNGFANEYDFYTYITDYVISQSILKDFPGLIGLTVDETNQNIINYLNTRIAQNNLLLVGIQGSSNVLGLIDTLQRSLNAGQPASFAWIQRLGHYIIDYIRIRIGDQVIDTHFGEWLEIWHSVTKRIKREKAYKELIGDIPELTTFNNTKKRAYELIVPLQFWFNRYPGQSLALAGLLHTDVTLEVKLKEFNEIAYFQGVTKFLRKPKLKCKLLAEYIYVEAEERNNLANKKLEYLIETVQFAGNCNISKSDIIDCEGDELNDDNKNTIKQEIYFQNPIKSLYWVFQKDAFVNGVFDENDFTDGDLVTGERRYHQYSFDLADRINPATHAKIRFSNRDREEFKDIVFYEQAMAYERHQSSPNTGVNCYSHAFAPEESQPTGAANFDRIDDATVLMRLRQDVVDDMNARDTRYGWRIYGLGLNILREMSGLAGLVFNP